jgi:hypothetical protein
MIRERRDERLRLYVDEDASEHAVVQGLRARGIDLLTALEAGQAGTSDEEQLSFAVQQARAIYTFNAGDFARLHRDWLQQDRDHCGIVVIPDQRYSIGEKIRRIAKFVTAMTADQMNNRIEYL